MLSETKLKQNKFSDPDTQIVLHGAIKDVLEPLGASGKFR